MNIEKNKTEQDDTDNSIIHTGGKKRELKIISPVFCKYGASPRLRMANHLLYQGHSLPSGAAAEPKQMIRLNPLPLSNPT